MGAPRRGEHGAGRAAWGVGAGQGCREYTGIVIVVSDHHAATETSHIELSTPTYQEGRSVRREVTKQRQYGSLYVMGRENT